jgi:hypothetical protein
MRRHEPIAGALAGSMALALLIGCGVVRAQNAQQGVLPRVLVRAAPASPTQTWSVPDGTDSVVVGFSNSTPRAPVVTGPLWNGSQPAPPITNGSPRAASLPVHRRGLKPEVLAEPQAKKSPAKPPPQNATRHATAGRKPDGGRR